MPDPRDLPDVPDARDVPQTYHDLLDLLPARGWTAMDRRRTRRLLAARDALSDAEAELVAAVRDAYDGGDSWRTIGTVLGITRQAAQRRFGARGGGHEPERPSG